MCHVYADMSCIMECESMTQPRWKAGVQGTFASDCGIHVLVRLLLPLLMLLSMQPLHLTYRVQVHAYCLLCAENKC